MLLSVPASSDKLMATDARLSSAVSAAPELVSAVAHVPSPLQNVDELALVPLFKCEVAEVPRYLRG